MNLRTFLSSLNLLKFCLVSKYLQLPNYPKDIEEMKIARYCMEQIFKCVFDSATFNNFIFNPEMIEILFYENKTNIPLQIQTKNTYLYCAIKHNILKIFFNHLKSTKLEVYIKEFHYLQQDILFKILTDGGNTFTAVSYLNVLPGLYNLVKQHIETSKDCSKMVANIIFDLSERADNIDSFYKDTINYQLCNKYNPKVRFSVYNQCRSSLPFVIIAKEES
uniref:Uncharacterized protein n=1 Tax=Meloidogyne hapla TaxID=6305 RepID=A0A1I8BDS4_MELHA